MAVTFILSHKDRAVSPVIMKISYCGKEYKKSIRESTPVVLWNNRKKRVRVTASVPEADLINDNIDKWEKAAEKALRMFRESRTIPTKDEMFKLIDSLLVNLPQAKESRHVYVTDYFDKYIERYSETRSLNRIKQYKLTRNVLMRYEKQTRKRLSFNDITLDFHNSFAGWFYSKGYTDNYFGSVIRILRCVYDEAREIDGLHEGHAVRAKNFTAPRREVENIYLTIEELMRLHSLKIDRDLVAGFYPELPANKAAPRARAYSQARDFFLIGAFTGLRFSDVANLTPQNITDDIIRVRTIKTGQLVVIPVHPVVREIINSGYDFNCKMYDQKVNSYIKEVARMAGIDNEVTINKDKGGRNVKLTVPKCELISTHTARRSFATNAYKSGIPTISIMKITGHTSEATFLKYIKISKEENASLLTNHPFFQD